MRRHPLLVTDNVRFARGLLRYSWLCINCGCDVHTVYEVSRSCEQKILNDCGVVNMFNRGEKPVGREDRAHGAIVCRYLSVLAVSRASRGIQCNGHTLISQLRAH